MYPLLASQTSRQSVHRQPYPFHLEEGTRNAHNRRRMSVCVSSDTLDLHIRSTAPGEYPPVASQARQIWSLVNLLGKSSNLQMDAQSRCQTRWKR